MIGSLIRPVWKDGITMQWKQGIICVLMILTSGWMLFDGSRALILGDYVTPASGEYAGQLGPWATIVESVGIDPRSTTMKLTFVLYGLAGLATAIGFIRNHSWGRKAVFAVTILGLWYLPVGTVTNLIALLLLFIIKR